MIDPETGALATDACPQVITEVFLDGRIPTEVCHLHGGWWRSEPLEVPEAVGGAGGGRPAGKGSPFRSWLRRVFGEGR